MRPVDELPYLEFEPDSGGTERIYADAWVSESIQMPALVTEHAVETGATISDHYLPQPIAAKVELFFSDSPLRGDLDPEFRARVTTLPLNVPEYPKLTPLLTPRGLIAGATGAVAGALGLSGPSMPTSYSALSFDTPPNRVRKVLQQILDLRESRKLIAVGFSVVRLEDMAIREARIERQSKSGDGGSIVLDLVQVQFTETDVAVAVPLPLEPRGQPKKSANAGGTGEVPAPKKSAAAAAYDAL